MQLLPDDPRSAQAIVGEKILRTLNDGHLSSVEGTEAFLRKRAAVEDQEYPLNPVILREHGTFSDFQGMKLIHFGRAAEAAHTVLYLHGGAYMEEVLAFHLIFCSHLAQRINAHVILPLYPLAPNHTWYETYLLLTDLYRQLITEKHTDLTLMGDSAGGGLAIAFCQYLRTLDLPQPDHLIGLSPWVDAAMNDSDYEPYRPLDPMLDVPGLQTVGRIWAGELDPKDPKISPTFGDNHGLPKTLLFTGTREILYPDIAAFYEKLKRDGVDAELVVGRGMNHVYPLYGIPESKPAVRRIDQEIMGQRKNGPGEAI